MSGHVSAASEDLAAQSEAKPVAIHSQSKREPDAEKREPMAEMSSKSEIEPDAEKREPMAEMSSKSEIEPDPEKREPMAEMSSKSEIEPDPEIPSKSEIEPDPEIPSKSERKPVPEIASLSKRKVRWPDGKSDDAENERWPDAKSDDGQSLSGKSSSRWSERSSDDQSEWISEVEWLGFINKDVPARSLSDVSIFKIPDFLKDTKREAYVPRRVLLGPYHYGRKNVRAVNINKKRALCRMRTKFNNQTDSQNRREFYQKNWDFYQYVIKAILNKEDEIRDSYEDEIRDSYEESMDSKQSLARMLSVDGCFVLQVLKDLKDLNEQDLKDKKEQDLKDLNEHRVKDLLFGEAFASNALKDILMLENQIPWIVLLELLRLENPKDTKEDDVKKTLLDLMVKGTSCLFEMSHKDRTALLELNCIKSADTKVRHLLDFVHKVIVYWGDSQSRNQGEHRMSIERCIGWCLQMPQDNSKAPNQDFKTIKTIPPAVELKNAGIKFRPCSGGIKQIRFDPDSSTIYLPRLSITSYTEILFRNLIAFEMCIQSIDNDVCGYVNLMDDLIDTQNDVAFLRSKDILTNQLGSDKEVADLFNGLFKGVIVTMPNRFQELRNDVNKNYKNKTRVRLAELWRDHFSSPWKTIALLVGFAILCLNLIQTVSTVIQTIHGKN